MRLLQDSMQRYRGLIGKITTVIVGVMMYVTGASAVPFEKTIGGPQDDEGYSITVNPVGALFVAGRTMSFGQGNWDLYVAKLRNNGVLKWVNSYGLNNWDRPWAIRPESTRVVVAGNTNSIGAGGQDALFIRLRGHNGQFKGYPKTYGGANLERAYSIEPTSDGGFIIVGEAMSFGAGDKDVYVIKTTERGKPIWAFTYGVQGSNEVGRSIQQTLDGGYIVAGWTDYYGNKKILVFRLNALGGLLWSKVYGGFGNEIARGVREDPQGQGGYIVTGWTTSWDNSDIFLMKLNNLGNVQWFSTYGGTNSDAGKWVELTPDGGYIVAAHTVSFATGGVFHDAMLLKTDNAGNVLWAKTYGGPGDDGFQAVVVTSTGYAAVGKTNSFSPNSTYDVYVVNTNILGETGCETNIIIDAVSRFILEQNLELITTNAVTMIMDTMIVTPGGNILNVCPPPSTPGSSSFNEGTQLKSTSYIGSQVTLKVIGRSVVLSRPTEYSVYSITGSLIKQGMGNTIRFANPGIYFIKLNKQVHKISILK